MASVTDNFNRTNESPIAGNWETILNGLRLDANSVDAVTVSVHSISAWRAAVNTFAADQRVDFTYTALSSFDKAGPAARCSVGTGGNAYFFRHDGAAADNDNGLHKLVNGVLTRLVSYTTALAANDVIRLECIGTAIKVYRNSVEIISVTDSSLASGQPGGYYFFDNSNATQLDDFVATDELSAAAVSSRRRLHTIYPVQGPYNPGQFMRRRGSAAVVPPLIRVITESAQVSESRARVVGIRRVVNDAVQVAESLVRAIGLRRVHTETMNIAESRLRVVGIRRVVSETANVAESVVRFIGLLRVRTESVDVAESILNRIGILRVRTETEQVSESTLRFVGLRRIINEAVNVAEAVVRQVGLTRVSTEVANVSENRVRVVGLRRVITEGVQAGESLLRLIGLVRVRTEATNVAETLPRSMGLARIVADAVQVAEAVVRNRGISRIVTEAVNVAESVARRLLSSTVYTTAVEFTVRVRAAVSATFRAKPAVDHKTRIRED